MSRKSAMGISNMAYQVGKKEIISRSKRSKFSQRTVGRLSSRKNGEDDCQASRQGRFAGRLVASSARNALHKFISTTAALDTKL
jgi:hypothetical protein